MSIAEFDVTALYVGLHALMAVALANLVLWGRLRQRQLPDWQPQALERVQANFVENVPIAMLLLLVLEAQGIPDPVLHGCGGTLLLLRALHAWGLGFFAGANYPRLIGAQGTFVMISAMAVAAILSAL